MQCTTGSLFLSASTSVNSLHPPGLSSKRSDSLIVDAIQACPGLETAWGVVGGARDPNSLLANNLKQTRGDHQRDHIFFLAKLWHAIAVHSTKIRLTTMARLRKPSPYESTFAIPSKEARATRSSPRKATRSLRYADSSDEDDEIPVLIPKSSSRALRQADSPSHNIIPYPIPHSCESDALTPRKQRVLRPIESNSRLLREPSAESLAKLERRGRRVRSGTMDTNLGKRTGLLYAKSLARSVAKKQAEKGRAGLLEDSQTQEDSEQPWGDEEPEQQLEEDLGVEAEEEHETSLLCGDEILQQTEDSPADEESSETDEGEPVVTIKQRRRQQAVRRVVSDSDDDDESEEMDEEKEQCIPQPLPPISLRQKETAVDQQAPTLTSMRPPHRKGKSTISNWAQEVVDLTSSPEPPASFILPPPTRTRTESFAASSRPTSSMSSGALAILT